MKSLILLSLFFVSVASANRIPEIEEYYVKKTSELLKTRFPNKPFTVFAKVDTGEKEAYRSKKEAYKNSREEAQLPYLGTDDEVVEIDFWSRTDLPIGSLISQLEKVDVKVKIDSSITNEEMEELKLNLSEQLKLVPGTDSIVIEKVDWTLKDKAAQRWWIVFGFLGGLIALFFTLYLLSKLSVKLLAKSLADPIAEIGKSTQAFANSALNVATDAQYHQADVSANAKLDGGELSLGSNLLELRNSGLELLERNMELLQHPDAELMEFLERHGELDPCAVGAILAELDEKVLRNLFIHGVGSWWFVALSQPKPMNPVSLGFLNELDRLRLRRNFDQNIGEQGADKEMRDAGIVFGRLNVEQLVDVFKGTALENADPILNILPRAFALAVGKALYPGQWAVLLNAERNIQPIDKKLLKSLYSKALEVQPLRKSSEIKEFFRDLDIARYLDIASFRDEKEFYLALSDESRIKKERVPYYQIFDANSDVIKLMSSDLNVKEWSSLLSQAENMEREHYLKSMTEKLAYMVRQELEEAAEGKIDLHALRIIKKKALNSYLQNTQNLQWQTTQEEAASETKEEPKAA